MAPLSYRHPTKIRRVKPTTRCVRCKLMRRDHWMVAPVEDY